MNKFHENGHRWVALNDPHPFLTGWKCVNCGMGTVESDGVMPSSNEKCSASPENSTMQRPLLPKPGLFIVACRGDTDIHGEKGRYDICNKTFDSYADAEKYAEGISASREPFIATIVNTTFKK